MVEIKLEKVFKHLAQCLAHTKGSVNVNYYCSY